ncbi:hypothetical protein KPB2_5349 [Klebsiella pneumoniae Kb677]|nr:hypothetical protein KPB2_5349 [Klebsiella pneumoniae Kb677]
MVVPTPSCTLELPEVVLVRKPYDWPTKAVFRPRQGSRVGTITVFVVTMDVVVARTLSEETRLMLPLGSSPTLEPEGSEKVITCISGL